MTERMDTFYACINNTLIRDILEEDGEYLVRIGHQDEAVKHLMASLDQSLASRVDDLLGGQIAIGELRECACFRAGFRLALELTR